MDKELTNELIDQVAKEDGLSIGYADTYRFWYDLKFHIRRFLLKLRRWRK